MRTGSSSGGGRASAMNAVTLSIVCWQATTSRGASATLQKVGPSTGLGPDISLTKSCSMHETLGQLHIPPKSVSHSQIGVQARISLEALPLNIWKSTWRCIVAPLTAGEVAMQLGAPTLSDSCGDGRILLQMCSRAMLALIRVCMHFFGLGPAGPVPWQAAFSLSPASRS